MNANAQNRPIDKLDLNKFAGKWYSLSSIPTALDKKWRQTIENYTLNDKGYYNVFTTYNKLGSDEPHSIKSKLFRDKDEPAGSFKAQFLWPFKIDYWVIELADDYSYTVIGHPKLKYLFILSRKPTMDAKKFTALVLRCKAMGYDVSKLVSQEQGTK